MQYRVFAEHLPAETAQQAHELLRFAFQKSVKKRFQ